MKYILLILAFLALSGCAGRKLMKDCKMVGPNGDGVLLSECEFL